MTDLVKFNSSHTKYLKIYSHYLKTKDRLTQHSVNTVRCKPIASVVCTQHVVKHIDSYSICFIGGILSAYHVCPKAVQTYNNFVILVISASLPNYSSRADLLKVNLTLHSIFFYR